MIAEKEEYAKEEIHKDMYGIISYPVDLNLDSCLVDFEIGNIEDGSFKVITLNVKLKDLVFIHST